MQKCWRIAFELIQQKAVYIIDKIVLFYWKPKARLGISKESTVNCNNQTLQKSFQRAHPKQPKNLH